MTIDNPYWEALKHLVEADSFNGNPVVGEYRLDRSLEENMARTPNRQLMIRKYSWTIPDPDTVAFVAQHAEGGLVDPIAGTGYWAYLLAQTGVDVVCYDLNPGAELRVNRWHSGTLHVEVSAKDCAEAAALHPDQTLFLSWAPYQQDVGRRTLTAYQGGRVIYIGEGRGGDIGDDAMHDVLDQDWTQIDSRQPVRWWGIKENVIVYERREN